MGGSVSIAEQAKRILSGRPPGDRTADLRLPSEVRAVDDPMEKDTLSTC